MLRQFCQTIANKRVPNQRIKSIRAIHTEEPNTQIDTKWVYKRLTDLEHTSITHQESLNTRAGYIILGGLMITCWIIKLELNSVSRDNLRNQRYSIKKNLEYKLDDALSKKS